MQFMVSPLVIFFFLSNNIDFFIDSHHLHEKPDTTIAKVNRTMAVRRNAKTSLLQPVGGNYNGVASSLKKNSSVENKTKSGILR